MRIEVMYSINLTMTERSESINLQSSIYILQLRLVRIGYD